MRGRGGAEHGGRGDDSNLRHSQAVSAGLETVAVVQFVSAGCDPLVGINGQRVDSFVNWKYQTLIFYPLNNFLMQQELNTLYNLESAGNSRTFGEYVLKFDLRYDFVGKRVILEK